MSAYPYKFNVVVCLCFTHYKCETRVGFSSNFEWTHSI